MREKIIGTLAGLYVLGFTVILHLAESCLLWGFWNTAVAHLFQTRTLTFLQAVCINAALLLCRELWGGMTFKQYTVLRLEEMQKRNQEQFYQRMAETLKKGAE